MSIFAPLKNALTRYWSALLAFLIGIYWFGGFVITVNQIQTEQISIRVKILALEQNQTKIDDKVNMQNVEVITRLTRMESILEEMRRKR